MNRKPMIDLPYTEKDGILYPSIQVSNESGDDQPLGRYGRMALEYLMENSPDRYTILKMDGSLMGVMHRVQTEAAEKIEALTQQRNHAGHAQGARNAGDDEHRPVFAVGTRRHTR